MRIGTVYMRGRKVTDYLGEEWARGARKGILRLQRKMEMDLKVTRQDDRCYLSGGLCFVASAALLSSAESLQEPRG